MLVKVRQHFVRVLLDCKVHLRYLSRKEIDVDREEGVRAILDSVLFEAHLDRVLRRDMVDDFIAKTVGLQFVVTLIDECA